MLYLMQAASKSIVQPSRRYSGSWMRAISFGGLTAPACVGGTPLRICKKDDIQITTEWSLFNCFYFLRYQWIVSCSFPHRIGRTQRCWSLAGKWCKCGISGPAPEGNEIILLNGTHWTTTDLNVILVIDNFGHSDRRQLTGSHVGGNLSEQCVQQDGRPQVRRCGRWVAGVWMFVDPFRFVGRVIEHDIANGGNLLACY